MPILRAVQEMEAEASGAGKAWWGVTIGQIAERMGKSVNEIGPQLNSLACNGYIAVASNTPTMGHPHRHSGITLLPKGRRALGEWPADKQLDSAAVQTAFSETITGPVVTVTGNNNVIGVSDSGDIKVGTGSARRSEDEPARKFWRWLKRILEAVTVFGAAVGVLGGTSLNPW